MHRGEFSASAITRRQFGVLSFAGLVSFGAFPSRLNAQRALAADRFYGVKITEGLAEIEAINLELTQDLIPPGVDVIVRCDSLSLSNTISTAGNNLLIFTRHLDILADCKIDSSGPEPTEDFPADHRAQDGQKPGENGTNGSSGSNGIAGGNVTIIADIIEGMVDVDASGGRGGGAQSGGYGAKGKTGATGANRGDQGGTGGLGGKGGLAGVPGAGANAGDVLVATRDLLPSDRVKLKSDLGLAGTPGKHGQPGGPGAGGRGGSGRRYNRCPREGPR